MNTKFSRFLQQNFTLFACSCAFVLFLFAMLNSCAPPKGEFAGNPNGNSSSSYRGYVVIANNATRTVVLYDASFSESTARVLRQYPTGNVPASIAYYDSENILVAVEGAPDRVDKINLRTAETTTGFILDSTNLTGTMKGIGRLSGGDVLVSDATTGAHMERFSVSSASPVRYTTGWPATLLNTTTMIYPASSSNAFVACAGGTSDMARVYTNVGGTTATVSATTPGTSLGSAHDAVGCAFDSNNRLVVAYNGTADAIRMYASTYTSVVWTYQDQALLSAPLTVGVRPTGNVLAIDTSNLVVELSGSDGSFVTSYSPQHISTANQILVIP